MFRHTSHTHPELLFQELTPPPEISTTVPPPGEAAPELAESDSTRSLSHFITLGFFRCRYSTVTISHFISQTFPHHQPAACTGAFPPSSPLTSRWRPPPSRHVTAVLTKHQIGGLDVDGRGRFSSKTSQIRPMVSPPGLVPKASPNSLPQEKPLRQAIGQSCLQPLTIAG